MVLAHQSVVMNFLVFGVYDWYLMAVPQNLYQQMLCAVVVPSSPPPRQSVNAHASVIVVGNHDTVVASRGLLSSPPQRPPVVAQQLQLGWTMCSEQQQDTSLGIDLGSKTPVALRRATWSRSEVGVTAAVSAQAVGGNEAS